MLDGVSLDQLRTFIAAADEGSFPAAARKLRRAQSVVSDLASNLKGRSALPFDRSALSEIDTGRCGVLADARGIVTGVTYEISSQDGRGLEPGCPRRRRVFPIEAVRKQPKILGCVSRDPIVALR